MKPTPGMRMTINQVKGYLASKGIPKHMIEAIQISLIYDAVTQGHDLQYDRIFSGIALMLRKEYGFGTERILRGLRAFDNIVGSVLTEEEGGENKDWTQLMQELKDETGIVVHTGDDNRLICEVSRE